MKENRTRELLLRQRELYPQVQAQDVFKFLYQSAFGCEHLLTSEEAAQARIGEEFAALAPDAAALTEELDGAFCRVPLSALREGLSVQTLAKLFYLSAKKEVSGKDALAEKLRVAAQLAQEGAFPFTAQEFEAAAARWAAEGYGAVRHSAAFREAYRPSYRVIAREFVRFLPLFAELDRRLAQGRVTLAVEGGSASGKSTLGALLEEVYGCTIFHTDDFFLQLWQRTPERFAEVGGNLDRERFLSEVLLPLSRGEAIDYRRFDCATMQILPAVRVEPKRLTVIEGAYSMHPELAPYYDFSVFLDVDATTQRTRIQKRNAPAMAERFFNEWIPLETVYFEKTAAKERCDLVIAINE
ncbi:MAG: hypothetical protein IIV78_06485 [Oscillospiraceae bacterium]|nr:hypothetical protein [Oscillospiraceae bacterium]